MAGFAGCALLARPAKANIIPIATAKLASFARLVCIRRTSGHYDDRSFKNQRSSLMECPVCGADAQDITVQTFDGKSIRCKSCGEYDISGSVYDPGTLQSLDPDQRLEALSKAKRFSAQGKRPMITTYNL